jgi:hypothetical protein
VSGISGFQPSHEQSVARSDPDETTTRQKEIVMEETEGATRCEGERDEKNETVARSLSIRFRTSSDTESQRSFAPDGGGARGATDAGWETEETRFRAEGSAPVRSSTIITPSE